MDSMMINDLLSPQYVTGGQSRLANRYARAQYERQSLVARPDDFDRMVASEIDYVQPVLGKPEYGKHPDRISALDAAIPEDHPLRGLPQKVRESTQKLLASPKYWMYKPKDLAHAALIAELQRPDEEGNIPLEKAYKYKREADAGLFQFGENKNVRKLPGYDQWVEQKRAAEDAAVEQESWLASPGDIAAAAATGAVIAGGLAGATTGGAGIVPGAVTGALTFGALEIPAHPFKKLLHMTEWYRAKNDSDSLMDKVKIFGVE